MRLLNGQEVNQLLLELFEKHESMSFAVAFAGTNTDIFEKISNNREKVVFGTIGTDNQVTDPKVLENFINSENIHFVLSYGRAGIFHPKVYLFESENEFDIIIGSANMTRMAFTANEELCLHLSQKDQACKLKEELKTKLQEYFAIGEMVTQDKLNEYQEKYTKNKNKIISANLEAKNINILEMSWQDYLAYLYEFDDIIYQLSHDRHLEKRCVLLKFLHQLFSDGVSFADIDKDNRQHIAGTSPYPFFYIENILTASGFFGYNIGAGKFKSYINNPDTQEFKIIAQNLDQIQLS